MLMRQQDRLEGRVQNIDEQLTRLESDKTLMKVQYRDTVFVCRHCNEKTVTLSTVGNWKEHVIYV